MLKGKEPITVSEFNKGLFTKGNILVNERGHSPNCMDIKWNFDGSIQKRLGCTSMNTVRIGSTALGGWLVDATTSLSPSMVSYWRMSEALGTRYDEFGTNNLTDPNNNINSIDGIRGQAAYFSGQSSPLLIQTNSSLETGAVNFTVGGWFYLDSTSTTEEKVLIAKRGAFDAIDSYTTLLLHCDGATTSFTDSSTRGNTVTAVGSATQSTTQSKFGGKSCALNGTTDYLTIPSDQQLTNGNMETWSGGASAAPDGWTLSGAGAVIGQSSTCKIGTYGAKVTRSGATAKLSQEITTALGHDLAYWKGRTITFGCWVRAAVASRARLTIEDGIADVDSNNHTGDDTWQYLTCTKTILNSATHVTVYCSVMNGDTSVYFDGAFVTDDATSNFDFTGGIWTIDKQIYVTDLSSTRVIWSQATDANNYVRFLVDTDGSLLLQTVIQGVGQLGAGTAAGVITINTMYHVEVSENGNAYYIFVDGVSKLSGSSAYRIPLYEGTFQIGAVNAGIFFSGYIDEFRVSKGVCRHTANFTAPTRAYGSNVDNYEYSLYIGTDNKAKFALSTGTGADVIVSSDSMGALSLATWYNIYGWQSSATHAGISVNLSVNTTSWASNVVVGSAPVTVGGYSNGTVGYLSGRADECSFWKKTLNANQRATLYGGGTSDSYALGNYSYSWGMFDFGATDIRWLTVAAGTGVYASSNMGLNFLVIDTARTPAYQRFERSNNVLIVTSDAYDLPMYWAGSIGTVMSVLAPGSAPASKISINAQGFLILLNSTGSTATNTGKRYFHYAVDTEQLTDPWDNAFQFPSSDDDEITNAFVVNRVLHVSTRYKIFKVSFVGGNPDWSYITMKEWGFLPRTVKRVFLNDREWVVGMDWNHRIRAFDGFNEMIISNNIENDNKLAEFALSKIPSTGSSQIIANAEFDATEQEYRLNVALGNDSSQTTNAIVFNVRTQAFYPYANQPYQSMCMAESNNRQYLMTCDRSGFVYMMNTGNTDHGTPINDYYTSPFMFNKVPGMVSKGGKLDLFFSPSSSGTITYQDCADFDRSFIRTKTIELQNDNSKTHLYKSEDIPSTHNIFQFYLTSSRNTNEPWVLTHYDLYSQSLGIGLGND